MNPVIPTLLKKAPSILVLVALLFFAVQAITNLANVSEAVSSGVLDVIPALNAVIVSVITSAFQPAILLANQKPHHAELFTSIHRDGEDYFAGQFMPAVEQFKLGADFDRYVLEQVGKQLTHNLALKLAINLTLTSISSAPFALWLAEFMQKNKLLAGRLYFEVPESAILHSRQQIESLLTVIKQHGFGWGVDQYGRNFQSLDYLEALNPAYVKVDHGYTGMVLKEEGDAAALGQIDDLGNVEIRTQRALVFTDEIRLVGAGAEQTQFVFLGVHGHGVDAEVVARAEDTHRDLAAVGGKDLVENLF